MDLWNRKFLAGWSSHGLAVRCGSQILKGKKGSGSACVSCCAILDCFCNTWFWNDSAHGSLMRSRDHQRPNGCWLHPLYTKCQSSFCNATCDCMQFRVSFSASTIAGGGVALRDLAGSPDSVRFHPRCSGRQALYARTLWTICACHIHCVRNVWLKFQEILKFWDNFYLTFILATIYWWAVWWLLIADCCMRFENKIDATKFQCSAVWMPLPGLLTHT